MTRVLLLTRLLLLRNKWLILLLMAWPLLIAMVIHFAGAGMDRDDIAALLGQESLYGIAMVAFAGSALLGAEERSGRIQVVLARAVTRQQYLAALLLAAWLPLLLYVAGFCAAGLLLNRGAGYSAGGAGYTSDMHLYPLIFTLARTQLCVGWVVAAASVLASVLLPTAFAGVATVAVAATVEYGIVAAKPAPGLLVAGAVVLAAGLFAVACSVFKGQDLKLSSD